MTDFIPMQNIYKLALALTSKEIGKISEDQISATQYSQYTIHVFLSDDAES